MTLVLRSVLVAFRMAIYFALYWGLKSIWSSQNSSVFTVGILIVLIIFSESHLAQRLQTWVMKQLHRSWFRFGQVLEQINQDLNRLMEFDQLLERIRRFLLEAFPAGEAFFYLNTDTAFEWLELK
ncbi:MAG: hypothetical protein D6715_11770, partial [Calditrichaeota bacterium]